MSEGIAHQYLAFMKLSGNPFCLQMCFFFFFFTVDSICYGWGYSKYYCTSIFRKAISKFAVCIRMHTGKCVYARILQRVCVCVCVDVALLKACCLCVQQAAHTLIFSIGETSCVAPFPYLQAQQRLSHSDVKSRT